jgi:hypothetical protein
VNNRWYAAGIAALVAGLAFGWFVLRPMPRPETIDPDPGYLIIDSTAAPARDSSASGGAAKGNAPGYELVLDTPKRGTLAVSPLWVVGRARGSWYFEAEFPIRLYDANDTLLTWASGRAQGEWMTRDYVPFAVVLNFAEPKTDEGTLVLEKSNPSGLPEHAAEVRIPVRFR